MRALLLCLLALPLAGQVAGEVPLQLRSSKELWNWFFWEGYDDGKLRVRVVAQLRSQPHLDTFLRVQGGPVIEYQATAHWNLIAGYYYQHFRTVFADPELQGSHRPFAGLEYAFNLKGAAGETRHLWEYFKNAETRDTARMRSRIRFEFPIRYAPFVQNEFFYDRLGLQASRSEIGFAYPIDKNLEFQLSYFREVRPERTGGTRDVISTRITFAGPWNKN